MRHLDLARGRAAFRVYIALAKFFGGRSGAPIYINNLIYFILLPF